jgi:hypothetical protein
MANRRTFGTGQTPHGSFSRPISSLAGCCLLLQDLVHRCVRGGEEDSRGRVLWDTTSHGVYGRD